MGKVYRRFGAMLLALALWPSIARAQATPVDVTRMGPQVGTRIPDFTLTDQLGRRQDLASLTGPSGLMLVFFRSADW